jgi:uncharacterized protein YeaO (DUF488 family)
LASKKRFRIRVKRAYEAWSDDDCQRILVDRVWPRGLRKAELLLDDWIKEIAPSPGLRRWFQHDGAKWDEFKRRYFRELDGRPEVLEDLLQRLGEGVITLIFGARDTRCNNAVALKEYLEQKVRTNRSAR